VKYIFALILVLIIFKHPKYRIQKIVLICVLGMVGSNRNLFVRKGSASQNKIGKHWFKLISYFAIVLSFILISTDNWLHFCMMALYIVSVY